MVKFIRYTFIFASVLFLGICSLSARAEGTDSLSAGSEEKPEKFNAGEMILEHIGDSHSAHLFGHVELPLPVILISGERGLQMFMSNKLDEGEVYNGYKLEKNKIIAVNEDGTVNEKITDSTWDFSITKNVASLIFSFLIMAWIFLTVAKSYRRNKEKAPKGISAIIEPIILFVRDDIAKPSIGKKYMRYLPFLLTVFFFIWINNLMGLIPMFPGGTNITGNIAVTMTLALLTFVITTFSGNKHYWRHIFAMPGVPTWVLFLLTPIEILGVFLRPFVLMVRLFANITAGHIIALSFFSLIFIFGEMNAGLGFGVSIFSLAFAIFMGALELLVAFLQAYVFTLLSAIYFGAAVEEHKTHDHHPHASEHEHIEEAAVI